MGWLKDFFDEFIMADRLLGKQTGFRFIHFRPSWEYRRVKDAKRLLYGSKEDKMRTNINLDDAYYWTGNRKKNK